MTQLRNKIFVIKYSLHVVHFSETKIHLVKNVNRKYVWYFHRYLKLYECSFVERKIVLLY